MKTSDSLYDALCDIGREFDCPTRVPPGYATLPLPVCLLLTGTAWYRQVPRWREGFESAGEVVRELLERWCQ